MKCGEVIDLMIGMNWCILIKNECGKVITTINPNHEDKSGKMGF